MHYGKFSDFFIKETVLEKRSQLGKLSQKLLEQPEKVTLKFSFQCDVPPAAKTSGASRTLAIEHRA